MRLPILLFSFLKVAVVESLREVSGYLGDTVILPSGADPSWSLSTIEWSIFSNNTWIATYRSGRQNIERVNRYKGRLRLNFTSGDLMIHNLTTQDNMEYTVDLINTEGQDSVNKIKLTVKKRLQKPTIRAITSAPEHGSCWIKLRCSSADEGVDFSWQVKPPSMIVYNVTDPDGNAAVLLAFLNATQNPVEFTCTSHRNTGSSSSVVTPKCNSREHDDKPQPPPRCRFAGFFLGGYLTGALTVIFIYCFREQIKAAWEYLKEKQKRNST